ncbi:MAG: hypothetical protein K2P84_05385 [Undibacterium sp.]|nr:hypothetical protein [Undibacterium sp.]
MQKIISSVILCFCGVFSFNAAASDISEDQALDILIAKIQDTGLYKSRLKMECLNFTNEAETKKYFDFKVYENHNGKNCAGDKNTAPAVDRFRVSKMTKKLCGMSQSMENLWLIGKLLKRNDYEPIV